MQVKNLKLFLLGIFVITIASCMAQKNSIITAVDQAGNNQPLEDSVLNNLRNDNDIVIAYAIENFAWVRKINYTIIAQKNGEWKGYEYERNLMKQNLSQKISSVSVNKTACDSLVNYIMQNKVWTIKGDNGENFCTNGNKNCNIFDVATERLWIITNQTVINPSYYAPEFYEKCCPDKDRALFLSVKKKIENNVSSKNITQ
jgi:hypothetical protein